VEYSVKQIIKKQFNLFLDIITLVKLKIIINTDRPREYRFDGKATDYRLATGNCTHFADLGRVIIGIGTT